MAELLTRQALFSSTRIAYQGEVAGYSVTLLKATQADLDYVFGRGDESGAEITGLFARLVVAGLGDANGNAMFKRTEIREVSTKIPLDLLKPLAEKIQATCGYAEEANADQVEDAIRGN